MLVLLVCVWFKLPGQIITNLPCGVGPLQFVLQHLVAAKMASSSSHKDPPDVVHDGDQHDDRPNEGNDSTQVAAETDYIWCTSQQPFSLSAGFANALFWRG